MKTYVCPNNRWYCGGTPELNSTECAGMPSVNHVLSETWQSAPMNPDVCWRIKTALELDAEKHEIAISDPVLKKVGAAILEAVFDMKQNPANYPTAASLKQKALELYKAKL